MHIIVDFTLFFNKRKTLICSGYRPGWKLTDDDSLHSAAVWLPEGMKYLKPGESSVVLLQPMNSEYWEYISSNTLMHAYEGPNLVGVAQVKQAFNTKKTTYPIDKKI